mmetsp:Transcript_1220/g.2896  ORF Transcript_1220/g.2896 Transcript_1220/m.2896 type:complete len:227 (+) Transcript_1220:2636-3316(+)
MRPAGEDYVERLHRQIIAIHQDVFLVALDIVWRALQVEVAHAVAVLAAVHHDEGAPPLERRNRLHNALVAVGPLVEQGVEGLPLQGVERRRHKERPFLDDLRNGDAFQEWIHHAQGAQPVAELGLVGCTKRHLVPVLRGVHRERALGLIMLSGSHDNIGCRVHVFLLLHVIVGHKQAPLRRGCKGAGRVHQNLLACVVDEQHCLTRLLSRGFTLREVDEWAALDDL